MVIKLKKYVKNSVVFSDDEQHRYILRREWDNSKKSATVIMLNPSKADLLITDKTIMNVSNFLIRKKYGSLNVINLFSFITTDPSLLKNRNKIYEAENNRYIQKAFMESDTIIVAWIRDSKKYITRKKEVEVMLKKHSLKVKCFEDDKGKKLRHPRDLNNKWKLTNYEFFYTKEKSELI